MQLVDFLLFNSGISLLDSTGLSMSNAHGGDFGRQKMWSRAGMMIVPPLSGIIIDCMSDYRGINIFPERRVLVLSTNQFWLDDIHRIQGLFDGFCHFHRSILFGHSVHLPAGRSSTEEWFVANQNCQTGREYGGRQHLSAGANRRRHVLGMAESFLRRVRADGTRHFQNFLW